MKKVYIKPIMNVVASSPTWLMAVSPTADVQKWDNQLSRDEDNHFWDDDEEYTPSTPQTPW